jgi:hypothetical protein
MNNLNSMILDEVEYNSILNKELEGCGLQIRVVAEARFCLKTYHTPFHKEELL